MQRGGTWWINGIYSLFGSLLFLSSYKGAKIKPLWVTLGFSFRVCTQVEKKEGGSLKTQACSPTATCHIRTCCGKQWQRKASINSFVWFLHVSKRHKRSDFWFDSAADRILELILTMGQYYSTCFTLFLWFYIKKTFYQMLQLWG